MDKNAVSQSPAISRRSAILGTAAITTGVGAALGTSACGGVSAVQAGLAAAKTGYKSGFLRSIAEAIGADVVVESFKEAWPESWSAWDRSSKETRVALSRDGFEYYSLRVYGDVVQPTAFFTASADREDNPTADLLVFSFANGSAVVLRPWAWQALLLFVHDLVADSGGDTRAGLQALCRIALIPSAPAQATTSLLGYSESLTYETRGGWVEFNRTLVDGSSSRVQVVATGIPTAKSTATNKIFDLSTLTS